MKKIVRITLILFLIFAGPRVLYNINKTIDFDLSMELNACASVEECDAAVADLNAQKEELQQKLAENQQTQKDLNEQIFLLIDQIKIADDEIILLADSIEQRIQEIAALEITIAEKEEDVKELLVQQQKENNSNVFLSMIMSSTSISDFMIKMNAVEKINGAKQTFINELEADKQELEDNKVKLEETKAQVETSRAEKQSLVSQHETKLAELHEIEESVHGQITDLELSEEELLQQRAILEGGVPSANGWSLPAATGSLTCRIGCYYDHIGTDFGMRTGTQVYSVAAGVVVYTQYSTASTGFGTMIVIAHNVNGTPYISIYAHLSVLQVSPGDVVRGGGPIALSGNTGASTGPHLHLEIVHSTNEYVGKAFRRSHLVDALDVLPRPSGGWYW